MDGNVRRGKGSGRNRAPKEVECVEEPVGVGIQRSCPDERSDGRYVQTNGIARGRDIVSISTDAVGPAIGYGGGKNVASGRNSARYVLGDGYAVAVPRKFVRESAVRESGVPYRRAIGTGGRQRYRGHSYGKPGNRDAMAAFVRTQRGDECADSHFAPARSRGKFTRIARSASFVHVEVFYRVIGERGLRGQTENRRRRKECGTA